MKKNIVSLIIKMSLPPALSMVIQSLYNLIDSIYITNYDELAMEAISIVYPIQNIILAIAVGIGVGINAFASLRLGENNFNSAKNVATTGTLIALFNYFVVLVIGLLVAPIFIKNFTNNPLVIDYSLTYINLIIIFSFTTIIQIALEKILQADKKMLLPMISLLVGTITNVILDPILIFNCNLGILGAAIATVIAQVLATLVMIFFVFSKYNKLKLNIRNYNFAFDDLKNIYKIAIPAFFINAVPSLMVALMNLILVDLSSSAITTFGIYYKLQYFVYMGVCGISQGTMPLMSFSYGAKDYKKLKSLINHSTLLSAIIGLFCTVIFLIIPQLLMAIFYKDEILIKNSATFLRLASLGFMFGCFNYILASYFQSIQKSVTSLIICLLRQLIILLPFAYFLSNYQNENGVYLAITLTEIITSIITFIIYKYSNKKLSNHEQLVLQ